MAKIIELADFTNRMNKIRDLKVKMRTQRILKAAKKEAYLSDIRSIGKGVYEVRIDIGPGYRIYITRRGRIYYFLTLGDKASQRRDIVRAQRMALELRKRHRSH